MSAARAGSAGPPQQLMTDIPVENTVAIHNAA